MIWWSGKEAWWRWEKSDGCVCGTWWRVDDDDDGEGGGGGGDDEDERRVLAWPVMRAMRWDPLSMILLLLSSLLLLLLAISLSLSVCCAFESFGQVFLLKIITASPKRCRFYMWWLFVKGKVEKSKNVRSGIWTHALSREPELESGALDHSAILTFLPLSYKLLYTIFNIKMFTTLSILFVP